MDAEQIEAALERGAAVRMPRFTPVMGDREKVELLEDYLNETAVARGELEEARLAAHRALKLLSDQWDAIVGWGMHLPSGSRQSAADVTEAKRTIRPELHDGIKDARWLVDRLSEQIDRLSHMGDDQVASRIYTLIAG